MFGWVSICGIIWGLALHQIPPTEVEQVEAYEAVVEDQPQVVRLEVIYNWDIERIKTEIENTFPEEPFVAKEVARLESTYKMVQSNLTYKFTDASRGIYKGDRERSFCFFQIHEPDWMDDALRLNLSDYKTNPNSCLLLARHIYDVSGKSFRLWTTYKVHLAYAQ